MGIMGIVGTMGIVGSRYNVLAVFGITNFGVGGGLTAELGCQFGFAAMASQGMEEDVFGGVLMG